MKVTVTTLTDSIFSLDVSEDLELENFKAFCEVESGIPSPQILIVFNGRPLTDDKKSLKDYGLQDGDMVIMQHHRGQNPSSASLGYGLGVPSRNPQRSESGTSLANIDFSSIQVPTKGSSRPPPNTVDQDDPKFIRDSIMSDPQQLAMLRQNNPPLADALISGDFEKFSRMIRELQNQRKERERQRLRLLQADPFDVEAQRLIAEEIRQKEIDANMEAAMEFNPESFGTVVMLYINCKVNGHPVKAFIDSGAQTTIMSTECAERCNIMRLVDTRFSGIAKGVGTQKIIGRVHMGQIEIEGTFLTSSFSILEDQKMDMLLGLDMLKRHQCTIDLKRNVLTIGSSNTETAFLSEGDLPESARLTNVKSNTLMDHEDAIHKLGGEDVGLAKALEESMKDAKNPVTNASAGSNSTKAGPSASNANTTGLNENTIAKIMKLGFSRDQVIQELQNFNGDETQATAALFAKSFKF